MSLRRHNVDHVSPSSLNLWLSNPHQWCRRYLLKEPSDSGPAMWRGTAVENGLVHWLRVEDWDHALYAAYTTFDQNAQGELSDEITAERALIEPMLRQLMKLSWLTPLWATQIKVTHWFHGCDVPCIGYVDLALDGKDTDLKTTKACPSAPRPAHVRQVALYRAARNKPGTVLYVTKAKTAEYDVTDAMRDEAMRDLEHAAQSLSRFLNKMDTPDEALACLPRNPDDFRTSAPSLRGTASGFEAMGA